MKKLCSVLVIFAIAFFLCGFAPKETTYFTLYYETEKIVVTEKMLSPAWHNYDSHRDFTKGKTVFERATTATSISKDFPEIWQILKKIQGEINRPAFDGNINFNPNREKKFWVTDARNGIEMDIGTASKEILTALKTKTHADIIIRTNEIPHKTEKQMLEKIGSRSQYSTRFDAGNQSRSNNIARSVACFNGLVLPPGEKLSYNRTVGPRTAERGYEEAKIIVDGEFVPGIGGGVCQTSTTLFNAAMLAGLTILKSQNHSLPISYVPLGRDAMVSSAVDLALENNTGAPVYFETGIKNGNNVFVNIYGNKLGKKKYVPVTEVTEKPMEVEVVGNRPRDTEGYRKIILDSGVPARFVKTYIETYDAGKLISKKLVRKSSYKGRTEILKFEKIPEEVVVITNPDESIQPLATHLQTH